MYVPSRRGKSRKLTYQSTASNHNNSCRGFVLISTEYYEYKECDVSNCMKCRPGKLDAYFISFLLFRSGIFQSYGITCMKYAENGLIWNVSAINIYEYIIRGRAKVAFFHKPGFGFISFLSKVSVNERTRYTFVTDWDLRSVKYRKRALITLDLIPLTRLLLVPHIYISESDQHWFR